MAVGPLCYAASMSSRPAHAYADPEGPFRAWHISEGAHYELSNGHPIQCTSAGERHAKANASALDALRQAIKTARRWPESMNQG